MAHEITIRADGFAEAAFSMKPAWHGLGKVFSDMMTSQEALTGAGLDWQVVQYPVAYRCDCPPEYVNVPNLLVNVREDNGLFLGAVSDRYQVAQNLEAFQFLDALIEDGQMKYEAAFSLQGGRKVVLLAQMPGVDTVVENDEQLRYVLMSLSHDGTGAIKFGPTAVRVVCANTYALAIRQDQRGKHSIKELSINHTGNLNEKLAQARTILEAASDRFAAHTGICQQLAQRRLSSLQWLKFLNIMCPQIPREDPDWTQRREESIAKTREAIRLTYHDERQDTAPMTAWAAFNAVTEHIDHLPRRGANQQCRAESRFNVCLYGPGRDMKDRAFSTLCRITEIEGTSV